MVTALTPRVDFYCKDCFPNPDLPFAECCTVLDLFAFVGCSLLARNRKKKACSTDGEKYTGSTQRWTYSGGLADEAIDY